MNSDMPHADASPKIAPVYVVWSGETLLDSAIENSWRHLINYPSWQNYSMVRHIEGEQGAEGELVMLSKEEEGAFVPRYYARTVKLDPINKIVIWKCYPESRSAEDFQGFVEFRLYEDGERTRYWYNLIYEFMIPFEHEGELHLFRKQRYENFAVLYDAVLPKLKELVRHRA